MEKNNSFFALLSTIWKRIWLSWVFMVTNLFDTNLGTYRTNSGEAHDSIVGNKMCELSRNQPMSCEFRVAWTLVIIFFPEKTVHPSNWWTGNQFRECLWWWKRGQFLAISPYFPGQGYGCHLTMQTLLWVSHMIPFISLKMSLVTRKLWFGWVECLPTVVELGPGELWTWAADSV